MTDENTTLTTDTPTLTPTINTDILITTNTPPESVPESVVVDASSARVLGASVAAYMAPMEFTPNAPATETVTSSQITFYPAPPTEEDMRRIIREELTKLLADRDAQNNDERKAARKASATQAAKKAAKLTKPTSKKKVKKAAKAKKTKKAKKALRPSLRPWTLGG